jgi:hypothetical protein
MDWERFQQFMLESAARHEAETGMLREWMKESSARHHAEMAEIRDVMQRSHVSITETLDRVSHTLGILVDNQVHFQYQFSQRMDDFRDAFVHHVKDPGAHRRV